MATVETTIGELTEKLTKVVEVSRLRMDYGWNETDRGFFKEPQKYPIATCSDYWPLMARFHPWKEVFGVYMINKVFGDDVKISISFELAAEISNLLFSENDK